MGRFILTILLAAVLAGFLGWYFELFTDSGSGSSGGPTPQHVARPASELGGWLYPQAKEDRKFQPHQVPRGEDPIAFVGSLQEKYKVDVPSPIPGQVLYIGEGVPEGVTQVAGVAAFVHNGYEQARVPQAYHYITKFYRPLHEGNEVENGQVVAEMDYGRAIYQCLMHTALSERAATEVISARTMDEAALALFQMVLAGGKSSAAKEVIEARLTRDRTRLEMLTKERELEKEQIELSTALTTLAYHELRFKMPSAIKRGFIKTIYHVATESVKETDPLVMRIYSTDVLVAEAFVEGQYARHLKNNMTVTLEPAQDEKPLRIFEGHRGKAAITSVAFVVTGKALHIVSAAEDGFLKLWRQNSQSEVANVNHQQPIKAMACAPRAAKKPWCVTGTADGKVHLWNLNPDNSDLPRPAAVAELADRHRDAVTALAFSPDGAYFASGSADGSIKLWRSEDGKLIYDLDPPHGVDSPHQGAITALSFTPHCRLVSASRDATLRVWALKESGAHLDGLPITGRSGNVNQLGVSQDGRWMLFDQGKSLQLMTVPEGQAVNTLKNPAGVTPFETLAMFSPDSSLILTGGAPEGRLQLWRAPSEDSRGYEVRQLATVQRSPVTCAAFAPALSQTGETAFAVSGTKDGHVYLWPVPSKKDVADHRIPNVPVQLIARGAEAGNRFRIGVEVPNPDGRLSPGRPVTIVVE